MKNDKASVSLILDQRREKKDGTYPVKLTIYHSGIKQRYGTGIGITISQWKKIHESQVRDPELKLVKRKLNAKVEKANKIIDGLLTFSFTEFESLYNPQLVKVSRCLLVDMMNEYITILNSKGRIGTAMIYTTVKNSLESFNKGCAIKDVTKQFLNDYEDWLTTKKCSPTTIGLYLRHLRAIVNRAIDKKLLSADGYPFKGYVIPSSRNVKKALSSEQIKQLLNFKAVSSFQRKAIDFWLFSYISNGINFTDICYLKPENIHGEFFSYFRAKTINTRKKDRRPIIVPLTVQTESIIARWRNYSPDNPYLFAILDANMTPKQQKNRIKGFIKKVNAEMNGIASELGFTGKLGTYVARHSHSTILKRKGASTEFIKDNLGHASVLTTENYLDDFEDSVKLDYAKMLVDL